MKNKKKKSKIALSFDGEGALESGLSVVTQILMTVAMFGLAYAIISS